MKNFLNMLRDKRGASAAEYALILAIIGAVVQTVRLSGFLWIDGALDKVENLERDNNELRAELKAISTKRNEQKVETGKNIEQAERGNREADKVAERIEKAPLPGNCRTPEFILHEDL